MRTMCIYYYDMMKSTRQVQQCRLSKDEISKLHFELYSTTTCVSTTLRGGGMIVVLESKFCLFFFSKTVTKYNIIVRVQSQVVENGRQSIHSCCNQIDSRRIRTIYCISTLFCRIILQQQRNKLLNERFFFFLLSKKINRVISRRSGIYFVKTFSAVGIYYVFRCSNLLHALEPFNSIYVYAFACVNKLHRDISI